MLTDEGERLDAEVVTIEQVDVQPVEEIFRDGDAFDVVGGSAQASLNELGCHTLSC